MDNHSESQKRITIQDLQSMQKSLLDLNEGNHKEIAEAVMNFFDVSKPDSFNQVICRLIYSAFVSQGIEPKVYFLFLKTIEEKDSSNDEVVGVTLATISQYTPEEFYKDKTLYEDWDSIGEYFDRHVRRPMQNLMTGTDIRDKEYFVPENSEDDE